MGYDRMVREASSLAELVKLNASVNAELRQVEFFRARAEESVAHLATLCTAASCLSEGIRRRDVPGAIREILLNLVGCTAAATFEVGGDGRTLVLLDSVGIDPAPYRTVPFGVGCIGCAAQTGDMYLGGGGQAGANGVAEHDLTACIPLRLDETVVGLIAVFRLLPQKVALEAVDLDLFALLTTLAAAALSSADTGPAEPMMKETTMPVEIERLRTDLCAAGVEHALPLLVAAFMDDAPQRLVAIEHAVAGSDGKEIGEAAHAYKSAAATMHAVALAEVLGTLERVRESGDIEAAVRLLPEVRQRNADALTFLATLPALEVRGA